MKDRTLRDIAIDYGIVIGFFGGCYVLSLLVILFGPQAW